MDTMYWELNYRSPSGWKRKYLFTDRQRVTGYINRYLRDREIDIKNLTLSEVDGLEKMFKVKFKVI